MLWSFCKWPGNFVHVPNKIIYILLQHNTTHNFIFTTSKMNFYKYREKDINTTDMNCAVHCDINNSVAVLGAVWFNNVNQFTFILFSLHESSSLISEKRKLTIRFYLQAFVLCSLVIMIACFKTYLHLN
jgi:hypothetical protein